MTGLPDRREFRLPLWAVFLVVVALGIALRVLEMLTSVPTGDGSTYAAMGNSFRQGDGLVLPWGPGAPGLGYDPVLANHPPIWPVILGGFYWIGGFSASTTEAASLIVSVLFIVVAFLTTRDLLGLDKAWFVAAFVAFDYFLIESGGNVYSENLVNIFYVATIWAIIRSLRDDRFVVLAGLLAGAAYLTKASIGYFFLVAGGMGLMWRFYYMRWSVFRNRYYLVAVVIFLSIAGAWATRNIITFGWPHWETSPHANYAAGYGLTHPLEFLPLFVVKIPFFLSMLATVGLFFVPQIRRELQNWRNEEVSALLLAISLPIFLGLFFASAFYLVEDQPSLWWPDNLRYVDTVFVPLLWLALRRETLPREAHFRIWKPTRAGLIFIPRFVRSNLVRLPLLGVSGVFFFVRRTFSELLFFGALFAPRNRGIRARTLLAVLLAFGLASANSATAQLIPAEHAASRYLAGVVHAGETIAVTPGVIVYYLQFSLADRDVRFVEWNGSAADFLLSEAPGNFAGWGLIAVFNATQAPGIMDSFYAIVTKALRNLFGTPKPTTPMSPGDLFLYRPL